MNFLCRALLLLVPVAGMAAERIAWTGSRVKGSPDPPPKYRLEQGFSQISFSNPLDLAFSPELDRWFVAEQGGKVWTFDSQGKQRNLAADFGPVQGREGTFYALTFDPSFASNRFIYVCYALKSDLPEGSRVSRLKIPEGRGEPRIDLVSEEVIITWLSGGHNGCCLKFGKDGFLYISTGDAAGPNPPDPLKTGQDVTDLLSSILRIDVHHRENGRNYAIPKDNPFVGHEKALPEIWAYGFRNPWRMGIDPVTGDLWVGDVGWELWELVYRVERGGNYGWSIVEGRQPVLPDDPRGPTPILPPTKEHPHNEAASITGGFVYYGSRFPELRGAFIYGDWETGKIWGIRADKGGVTWSAELTDSTTRIIAFAPDRSGEIAVLDYNGGLYTLEPNSQSHDSAEFPRKLSETGLFGDVRSHTPAPGVYPFDVIAPMWRDFATAERFIALPDKTGVNVSETPWKYPSNAVLAVTYALETVRGNPASLKRIETQLLHFNGDAWGAYSYRWNEAQTDAELVPAEGMDEVLRVEDQRAPGGIRQQPWRFHSRTECLRCHNPWCGTALGFQPEQLGPAAAKFADLRVLSSRPRPVKPLVNPHDPAADLSARARSYLHVNCSHCHRENAGGSVPSVMNYDLPLEKTRMLNARPVLGDLGLDDGRIIAPGRPFSSVLLFRASATGRSRMPYLMSELVDEPGVALLREWIASLNAPAPPATATEALRLAHELARYPAETRIALARGALRSANPLTRDLFDRFLPPEEQTTLRQQGLSKADVLALQGDAERGRTLLFEEGRLTCLQCHTFNNAGRRFGPDLSEASRGKTRAEILESILEPSSKIAPEYVLYNAELADDDHVTGVVVERSEREVVLRDSGGIDHRLQLAAIKNLRAQQLSAMPEGLLIGLTAQDVADLIAALVSSKSP